MVLCLRKRFLAAPVCSHRQVQFVLIFHCLLIPESCLLPSVWVDLLYPSRSASTPTQCSYLMGWRIAWEATFQAIFLHLTMLYLYVYLDRLFPVWYVTHTSNKSPCTQFITHFRGKNQETSIQPSHSFLSPSLFLNSSRPLHNHLQGRGGGSLPPSSSVCPFIKL